MAAGFWMLAAAGAAALAIWLTTAWLLDVADEAPPGTERVKIQVDAVRTGLAAGGGAGAAVGLMLAFRRQHHQELATALGELDAAERRQDAVERRITELYNAAAEQLGSDKAPVRLTALYTLERLANDNERHRQTIVNIICAYLRMPYTPPRPPAGRADSSTDEGQRRAVRRYQAARTGGTGPGGQQTPAPDTREERQVRLTAQRILKTHLHSDADEHWSDIDLDLSEATLMEFRLDECALGTADFRGATFVDGAYFHEATFAGDADFASATFTGIALFYSVTFTRRAGFDDTTFTGPAFFGQATFTDHVGFAGAVFAGNPNARWITFSSTLEIENLAFTQDGHHGPAVVVDRGRGHVLPPGWRIEPTQGLAGQIVATSTQAP
ncbi:pentapeptide repeat-containing protein [Actinomadura mexicana]|uniref:Pentapeptide repeat-containing protein n=1 Tax=Actinomadura mexicana TaxID=134959 RepID=A0A239H098_9ACTN|nr:pentapeptide repeat-containing protein [Actinomadura mexicana]SNS74896.1 Pentapeptide repeat-containing protein [Actinomadura mexicana]